MKIDISPEALANTKRIEKMCPQCGFLMKSASALMTTEEKPDTLMAAPKDIEVKAGMFTVCVGCAAILMLNDKLELELADIKAMPESDLKLLKELSNFVCLLQIVNVIKAAPDDEKPTRN